MLCLLFVLILVNYGNSCVCLQMTHFFETVNRLKVSDKKVFVF